MWQPLSAHTLVICLQLERSIFQQALQRGVAEFSVCGQQQACDLTLLEHPHPCRRNINNQRGEREMREHCIPTQPQQHYQCH